MRQFLGGLMEAGDARQLRSRPRRRTPHGAGTGASRSDPGFLPGACHGVPAPSPGGDGQPLDRHHRAREPGGILAGDRRARPRPRSRLGSCASGVRRRPRRGPAVRHPIDRRAISSEERPLRCRPTAARLSPVRIARRRTHRQPDPLGRSAGPAPRGFGLALTNGLVPRLGWALLAWALTASIPARADSTLHCLWELHGKHNIVYLLGSIHTLRASDYPLAPAVVDAYKSAEALVMEIDLNELASAEVQSEMLGSATLTDGKTLHDILGAARYARAETMAREVGLDLALFDRFAPWFVAEAISQMQLMQLGFDPSSGVEMYFVGRARTDGKSIAGLETAHDQIALFQGMSMDSQAEYLVSSLEQARDLPKQVDDMVHAWQRGDTAWFESEIKSDVGRDPALYQSLLVG